MNNNKILMYEGSDGNYFSTYGTIGEETGFLNLKVGDLVSAKFDDFIELDNNSFSGIVVKYNNKYCVMGAVGIPLNKLKELRIVLPYNLVTEDITRYLHSLVFSDTVKLTKEEIEKRLGYPIEIVEK